MTELKSGAQLSFTDKLIKSSPYSDQEKQFIIRNLDKKNVELGNLLRRSEASIRNFLSKENIRRSKEQLEQIRERIGATHRGENNGNYKEGRSTDHYFYKKRMREKYPEKMNARNKVYRAIRSGKLKRLPCYVCGSEENIQAHHPDHSKPLEVIWLCPKHHREFENQNESS